MKHKTHTVNVLPHNFVTFIPIKHFTTVQGTASHAFNYKIHFNLLHIVVHGQNAYGEWNCFFVV
jgi:hypothetical protein